MNKNIFKLAVGANLREGVLLSTLSIVFIFSLVAIFGFLSLIPNIVFAQFDQNISPGQYNQSQIGPAQVFNINLKKGDIHPQVKLLQQFLNSNGYIISESGPGSIGSETEMFGAQTERAVKSFQCANNISCTGSPETNGYGTVGPNTRSKINSLISVLGFGSNTGTSVITQLPIHSTVLAANTGNFAEKINADLDVLVNGPGKGQFYMYENNSNTLGGALKPNRNSWLYPLDFTGVSTWQGEWGDARKTGTLIAPQYMIQAAHYVYPTGNKVRFADRNGVIEERTTVDFRVIPQSDIQITKLDRPLPTDRFKIYKIFSKDEFIRKNSFDQIPLINNRHGQTSNLKFLTVNQDRSVVIYQAMADSQDSTDSWNKQVLGCENNFGSYTNPNFAGLRTGDSGSPGFVSLNNELILIETHSGALSCMGGPFISNFAENINSAIAEMGGTDRLGTVSLSGFSDVNHYPQIMNRFRLDFQITEKSPAGTVVGKVLAQDSDLGQTLTYSIIGGSGMNYFNINSQGEITVKNSAGFEYSSPALRTAAGIGSTNLDSNPVLTLEIRVTDNGYPVKHADIVDVANSSYKPVRITLNRAGPTDTTKDIKFDSQLFSTSITSTTPIGFRYYVKNWPVSTLSLSLVPFNADGVEIRGGSYGLGSFSISDVPQSPTLRTGSGVYRQTLPQSTIDTFEGRARGIGALISGGLKLPIKFKVKICGSGTDSTLCALSADTISFVQPVATSGIRRVDTDGDGRNDEVDYCANTPANLISYVNNNGCVKPLVSSFDIKPNLETNLNMTPGVEIGKTGLGKISYRDSVIMTRSSSVMDIDNNLKFYPNKVELNTNAIPELNRPATITLYNVRVTVPKIMRNGVVCNPPTCVINSYSNGVLVFTVTGFSTYEVVDGAIQSQTNQSTTTVVGSGNTISGGNSNTTTNTGGAVTTGGGAIYTPQPQGTTQSQSQSQSQIQANVVMCSPGQIFNQQTGQRCNTFSGSTQNPNIQSQSGNQSGINSYLFIRNLTVGSRGDDVIVLQNFLISKGYLSGDNNTGYFGQVTRSALAKWQFENGISPAEGYFGALTRARVQNQNTASGANQLSNTYAPSTVSYGQVGAQNSSLFTRNLTIGSRGGDVVVLQNILISKGYLASGNNTGYFGQATRSALVSWQNAMGIYPASGYFGPLSRGKIGQ